MTHNKLATIATTLVAVPFITGVSMALVSRFRYSNPWSDYAIFSFIPSIGLVLIPGLYTGDLISDAIGLTARGDNYRKDILRINTQQITPQNKDNTNSSYYTVYPIITDFELYRKMQNNTKQIQPDSKPQ